MQTRYPTRRRLDIGGRACRYLPRRSLSSSRVGCGSGISDNPTQLWETTRTGPFSSAVPKTLEPGCADDCIGYVANLVFDHPSVAPAGSAAATLQQCRRPLHADRPALRHGGSRLRQVPALPRPQVPPEPTTPNRLIPFDLWTWHRFLLLCCRAGRGTPVALDWGRRVTVAPRHRAASPALTGFTQ